MGRTPIPTSAERVRVLEAQLAEEKKKTKALTAERANLARRLEAAESSARQLNEALTAKTAAEAQQQTVLREAQQRFGMPEATIGALVAKLGELAQSRLAIQKQLETAQAEFERRTVETEARRTEAEAALADARKQIDVLRAADDTVALIDENRRIAAQLESMLADFETYRQTALQAEAAIKQARDETDKTVRAELESRFAAERTRLERQISTLTSQLQDDGKTPLISAGSAANLVDDFVRQLRQGLSNLRVRDGEVKLKVAFGQAGDQTGFVLPTAASSPELKENLHEVVLRFDQTKP